MLGCNSQRVRERDAVGAAVCVRELIRVAVRVRKCFGVAVALSVRVCAVVAVAVAYIVAFFERVVECSGVGERLCQPVDVYVRSSLCWVRNTNRVSKNKRYKCAPSPWYNKRITINIAICNHPLQPWHHLVIPFTCRDGAVQRGQRDGLAGGLRQRDGLSVARRDGAVQRGQRDGLSVARRDGAVQRGHRNRVSGKCEQRIVITDACCNCAFKRWHCFAVSVSCRNCALECGHYIPVAHALCNVAVQRGQRDGVSIGTRHHDVVADRTFIVLCLHFVVCAQLRFHHAVRIRFAVRKWLQHSVANGGAFLSEPQRGGVCTSSGEQLFSASIRHRIADPLIASD